MQSPHYDIAIIGLGPGGATIARLLPNSLKIIALDKCGETKGGFTKPCGGLLAPSAQKIIAELGLTLPKSIMVDPQIFSVRTIDVGANLTRHYQRFYLNLDRFEFDRWLRSLIPSEKNKTIFTNSQVTKIERVDGGFSVTFNYNGVVSSILAKKIVGADGANSIVRRSLFGDFKLRTRLSIQQWFKDIHPTPFYSCIFDKITTDTYAWGLTKDNYFIFGGAFNKNARAKFETLKDKLELHGFKLKNPVKTEACLVAYPKGKYCLGGDGAFLIGEAGGFVSPSSFEGISFALRSAKILAYILESEIKNPHKNPHKAYKRATKEIRQTLFFKSAKAKIIYSPFWRKLILKSGISSIK